VVDAALVVVVPGAVVVVVGSTTSVVGVGVVDDVVVASSADPQATSTIEIVVTLTHDDCRLKRLLAFATQRYVF